MKKILAFLAFTSSFGGFKAYGMQENNENNKKTVEYNEVEEKKVITNEDKRTFFKAITDNKAELVEKMIKDNPEIVNVKNKIAQTALHKASNPKIIKLLLENKADIKAQDEYLYTPAHQAVRDGNLPKIELLYHAGADFSIKNVDEWDVFTLASQFPNRDIIKFFVINGAVFDAKDDQNRTVLDIAIQNNEESKDFWQEFFDFAKNTGKYKNQDKSKVFYALTEKDTGLLELFRLLILNLMKRKELLSQEWLFNIYTKKGQQGFNSDEERIEKLSPNKYDRIMAFIFPNYEERIKVKYAIETAYKSKRPWIIDYSDLEFVYKQ